MTSDPITLRRVHNLWQTTRTFGLREITTAWAIHMMVRIDGGPPPDPGQLGPACAPWATPRCVGGLANTALMPGCCQGGPHPGGGARTGGSSAVPRRLGQFPGAGGW